MTTLAALTDEFDDWADKREGGRDEAPPWARMDKESVEQYAAQVLPLEIQAMEGRQEDRPKHGQNLVLTVGTSPQPLLVSIAWWRPARILLAPSAEVMGAHRMPGTVQQARWIMETVCADPGRFGLVSDFQVHILEGGLPPTDPAAALLVLRDWLQSMNLDFSRTHLDITGGKKTMSATAFALASELGLSATYLDGEYRASVGFPQPGTLACRHLPDPQRVLGLARLRTGRSHYQDHQYKTAAADLQAAAQALEAWGRPEDAQRLKRASSLATACQAWADARYDEAWELFERSHQHAPLPVGELGPMWTNLKRDKAAALAGNLRGMDRPLALYLVDAWRHIQRWHARQPRDAYLRWYGLGEYAMEALLVRLREDENALILDIATVDDERRAKFYKKTRRSGLVRLLGGARNMVALLGGSEITCTWRNMRTEQNDKKTEQSVRVDLLLSTPLQGPGMDFYQNDQNRNLRNACAHKLAAVSVEDASKAGEASKSMIQACIAAFPNSEITREQVAGWFESDAFKPPSWDTILPPTP